MRASASNSPARRPSLPPPGGRLARPIISTTRSSDGLSLGLVAEARRASFARTSSGVVGVVESDCLVDGLEQRPVGDALSVREATAAGDQRLPGDTVEEFLHQPRLPDAGEAEHREELTGAIADRLLESVVESPALTLAADHRRHQPSGDTRPRRRTAEERQPSFAASPSDRVAQEPPAPLVEQDLSGSRRLGEADEILSGSPVVRELRPASRTPSRPHRY